MCVSVNACLSSGCVCSRCESFTRSRAGGERSGGAGRRQDWRCSGKRWRSGRAEIKKGKTLSQLGCMLTPLKYKNETWLELQTRLPSRIRTPTEGWSLSFQYSSRYMQNLSQCAQKLGWLNNTICCMAVVKTHQKSLKMMQNPIFAKHFVLLVNAQVTRQQLE